MLILSFRDGVAGEIGEKVGLFGDKLLLLSNMSQSKLNFSLDGLMGGAEMESAISTSPSRSVDRAGLKNESTKGMVFIFERRAAVLNISSCFSLSESA